MNRLPLELFPNPASASVKPKRMMSEGCQSGYKIRRLNSEEGDAIEPKNTPQSEAGPKRMMSEGCQSGYKIRRLDLEEGDAIEPKNTPQSEAGSGSHSKEESQRLFAKSHLHTLCSMRHWKEPIYDCSSEGPSHKQLFTATVIVEIKEGSEIKTLECFGVPQYKKKIATERAAEAALWCLNKMGYT